MTHDGSARRRMTLGRRLNLPFWAALGIVVVAYAMAFYVLRLIIPERDIAGTLAALVLAGRASAQERVGEAAPGERGQQQ